MTLSDGDMGERALSLIEKIKKEKNHDTKETGLFFIPIFLHSLCQYSLSLSFCHTGRIKENEMLNFYLFVLFLHYVMGITHMGLLIISMECLFHVG